MDAVRAKFYVRSIENYSQPEGSATVKLGVVYSGDANKNWAKYTPSGSIELMTVNAEAVKFFQLGKEYFVDFTEAPVEVASA